MGFLDRFRGGRPEDVPGEPPAQESPPAAEDAFAGLRDAALAGVSLAELRERLAAGLAAHGVSERGVPAVMERVGDGVALLELGDGDRRSRIGGAPELPDGVDWPVDHEGEPLTFVARVDLGELPKLAPLPDGGTLLVFWSERFHEWDRMDFRVATRVFWLEPGEQPVPAATPDGAEAYEAVPLTGAPLPVLGELERIELGDEDGDALASADDELMDVYRHHLLGRSRDVQGPVLSEIPYWFEQGFPETRQDFTEDELAGEGWLLLAQFESTGRLMFGDAGALYLVIPRGDLDARRFDRVIGIMQCS